MDLEEVQVSTYLRNHPVFLEEWLARNADSALLEAVRKKWSASKYPQQKQPQNEKNENSEAEIEAEISNEDVEVSKLLLGGVNEANEPLLEVDEAEDDTLPVEPSPRYGYA